MTKLLTSAEFAEACGVCIRTIQRTIALGRLKPHTTTPGGHARFHPNQLKAKKWQGKSANSPGLIVVEDPTTPSGTTEKPDGLSDYRFVQKTLKKRAVASRRSSSKAAPSSRDVLSALLA